MIIYIKYSKNFLKSFSIFYNNKCLNLYKIAVLNLLLNTSIYPLRIFSLN
jgi:ABC-type uncharacterized transport system permease subunit